MIKQLLIIGGGTCSGKTTLAHKLAAQENGAVFSVDDRLGEYAGKGIEAGCPVCTLHAGMSLNDFFMRDPRIQCNELIRFYKEIAPFMKEDLARFCRETDKEFVIAEGIAFLPEIAEEIKKEMSEEGLRICSRYLFADPAVHDRLYREREWTETFLKECKEPEEAFRLWMKRDALFAEYIKRGSL